MSYSRVVWKNREESAVTPLNADNLNNMDIGIQNLDSRMSTVETRLNGVTDPRYIVKDWEIDTTTGIIVVKWADNRTQSYDLNLEKIPVNFSMSTDGVITMETADGTKYTADLKRYIKPYVFNDSDVIDVVEDGNNITFNIIKGSITDEYIEGEYLSNCIIAKDQAESAADTSATKARNSADSATLSESYAVGGTGTREGEDSDNAKYYYEQAKAISNVEKATTDKMGIVKIPTDGTITIDPDGTIHASAEVTVDTELDETSTNAIANSAVTGAISELSDDVSTNTDNIATNAENIEIISGGIETLNTDLASVTTKLSDNEEWLKIDNSFDGQWSQGYAAQDGTIKTDSKYVCTTNLIDVGDKTKISLIYGEIPRIAEICCYSSSMSYIGNVRHDKIKEYHGNLLTGTKYIRIDYSNTSSDVTPSTATSIEVYIGGQSKSNVALTEEVAKIDFDTPSISGKELLTTDKMRVAKGSMSVGVISESNKYPEFYFEFDSSNMFILQFTSSNIILKKRNNSTGYYDTIWNK